jgi:chemotaxis protein CheX
VWQKELGGDSVAAIHIGSVGFVGAINGLVYLYMKTDFVADAAVKITGLESSELGGDMVSDVCGELTNIFGGGFKNAIANLGYDSMLTIPTVFSGDELRISTIDVARQFRAELLVNGQAVVADLVLAEPSPR